MRPPLRSGYCPVPELAYSRHFAYKASRRGAIQMVTIKSFDGGEFDAYVALPAAGFGPGIVVLQEIFGVNEFLRGIADWYAARGFVAICPDLFWRQERGIQLTDSDADFQKAIQLYQGLDEAKAVEDSAAAIDFLRQHPACSGRAGAVGFCL